MFFLTIMNIFFYNFTKLLGQNIHKSHFISFPSLLSSYLSDQFISSFGKFGQIWKENLQDPMLMPKKEHGEYPFGHSPLPISSSIPTVQAAHL